MPEFSDRCCDESRSESSFELLLEDLHGERAGAVAGEVTDFVPTEEAVGVRRVRYDWGGNLGAPVWLLLACDRADWNIYDTPLGVWRYVGGGYCDPSNDVKPIVAND